MRQNPKLDISTAITELAVGEALVSLLDDKGRPGVTERVYVLPPASQIGPITPQQRKALIASSIVAGVYEKTLDRESAFEKLSGRTQARMGDKAASKDQGSNGAVAASGGGIMDTIGGMLGGGAKGSRASAGEQMIKSAAGAIGREVGRQIIRGVLGSILGGSKRR
jgi:hypothetical protein